MRTQAMRLAMVLALATVVLVGVTSVTQAQTSLPLECKNLGRFDMNGDGVVDRTDLIMWKSLYTNSRGEDCDIVRGNTSGCPAALDLDGNGKVDLRDAGEQVRLFFACARRPTTHIPVR